ESRPVLKQVETIRRAAGSMKHLIDDLLDVATIQAGRLSIRPEACPAAELVQEAVEQHQSLARSREVALTTELSLEGVELACGGGRLLRVFSNLVGNAPKFCRPGDRVTIRGQAEERLVRFEVVDSGPGIAPAALPHVFDPYWATPQDAKQGTGLGLFIVKG